MLTDCSEILTQYIELQRLIKQGGIEIHYAKSEFVEHKDMDSSDYYGYMKYNGILLKGTMSKSGSKYKNTRPINGCPIIGLYYTDELLKGVNIMLGWALMFLIIAIIAAAFGFGGIAAAATGIAKILFFIFLLMFVILLFVSLLQGRRGPPSI